MKKVIWITVSALMALSTLISACSPAGPSVTPTASTSPSQAATTAPVTPTTVAPTQQQPQQPPAGTLPVKPQYGGTLKLAIGGDITNFDDALGGNGPGLTNSLTNENMWTGDWAKGPAGGYGQNLSDWIGVYDVFSNHTGQAAEGWKWSLDAANTTGTLVYQVRQGIHYGLNTNSEASKLVNGREMNADDVVFSLRQVLTSTKSYMYAAYPTLRTANITKTAPWEVTIKVNSSADLITAVAKFGSYVRIVPPEVVAKYGDMGKWQNSVGTGPFILTDSVPGSQATLPRNPNYWKKNPVGPGLGDQVPYIDALQYIIIPDASTRLAAMRTAKVDRMANLAAEDSAGLLKNTALKQGPGINGGPARHVAFNSSKSPFKDVNVRRALFMAVDLQSVKKNLNNDQGQLLTWPYEYTPAYKDLYLGLDDPDMPQTVKDLFVYNPDKAKQLLKDAGYPTGLKITALIGTGDVDYFSVIKDMWSKIGVDLTLNAQTGQTLTNLRNTGDYDVTTGSKGPISVFYHQVHLVGIGPAGGNSAFVSDPFINKAEDDMATMYLNDQLGAMKKYRELMKYVLDQAYTIPAPTYPLTTVWWPWLKNYSGEQTVGYYMYESWATWVWIDGALKKSMGY